MRVMFVLDKLNLGGAERHTMVLASELSARGHVVSTVVLLAGGSKNFPKSGFPSAPKELGARMLLSKSAVGGLRKAIRSFSPDIVFAVNQSALLATTLTRLLSVSSYKVACIFHTTVIASTKGKLFLQLFKRCTERADALIFVSDRQKEYWMSRGLRSPKLLAIRNGTDTDRFAPHASRDRENLRKSFGFREDDLVLLLVGRLAQEKNHSWLLQTLARMNSGEASIAKRLRVLFLGEGPLLARLENLTGELNLGGQVTFGGAYPDVAPLLSVGDVGLIISNAVETFSLAALEMMASGLPMIMTDIGGAKEMVEDGKEGYIIEINDDDALIRALELLGNNSLRSQLGIAARERVLKDFAQAGMIDQYEHFLFGQIKRDNRHWL